VFEAPKSSTFGGGSIHCMDMRVRPCIGVLTTVTLLVLGMVCLHLNNRLLSVNLENARYVNRHKIRRDWHFHSGVVAEAVQDTAPGKETNFSNKTFSNILFFITKK
jgi:hypothetical protein